MGDTCDSIQQLLPWFVSESLELEEKLLVFEHLRTCAACRQDLVAWLTVKQEAGQVLVTGLDDQVVANTWHGLQSLIASEDTLHATPQSRSFGTWQQAIAAPLGVLTMTLDMIKTECAQPLSETFTRTTRVIRGVFATQS